MHDSEMWRIAWAKAPRPDPGERRLWSPLHTHLTDTCEVVRLIWDNWLGRRVREVIAHDVDGDDSLAREVAALAGAMHDIGKCTSAFAGQVPEMRREMESRGFPWPREAIAEDSRTLPHALAGHLILQRFLEAHGVPSVNAGALSVVVGGHHGAPPSGSDLREAGQRRMLFGVGAWESARQGLMDYVVEAMALHAPVAALRTMLLSDASQVLLTAVVIMADWIASNAELFPLVPAWTDNVADPTERARRGWKSLDLPHSWQPTSEALTASATDLLQSRFDVDFVANDVQEGVLSLAREMPEPGLLLIEAVMGVGKTEASLLAAEVLAARFGCVGVFYGLPTRATADAMFDRLLTWWERLPGSDLDGQRGVALRHGTAALNDTYRALPRRVNRVRDDTDLARQDGPLAGELVDVGRDAPSAPAWSGRRAIPGQVLAHFWTSGRKQASFADTVVATIDHELLAALQSRHVVLRHLGLARQVVVLDEVHAADTWMLVYLERALEWLGRYRVPVIAMSATLAPAQRQRLVDAYERGRRAALQRPSPPPEPGDLLSPTRRQVRPFPQTEATDAYPLLTSMAGGRLEHTTTPVGPTTEVGVEWIEDQPEALVRALAPVVEAGGCVLIVRNTVRRAVETFRSLRPVWGESVSLTHSRYVARDRLRNDEWLRGTFGTGDGDRAGRVVVATQVAEQSLDVDFDLLVTDIAPIDLLLQRIGRLHRHPGRARPASAQAPRCLVTGLSDPSGQLVPEVDSGAVAVYGRHHLLRTAAILSEHLDGSKTLTLPADVPRLVRRCYGDDGVGPAHWQPAMRDAHREFLTEQGALRSAADTYLLKRPGSISTVDLLANSAGEAETSTGVAKQVRNADGGFEVIVLLSADDGLQLLPQFEDDRRVPTDVRPDRETARQLARSIVRVPAWVTSHPAVTDAVLDDLTRHYYPSWQKEPILSGQLILLLDQHSTGRMGPFIVSYDTEVGLEVTRERSA